MTILFDYWPLVYLALGACAGFFAGLLGVGGGVILVPALTLIYAAEGFPGEHLLHLALGTSMATILFTAAASLRAHHRHGAVRWPLVRGFTPGILIGTALGTVLARHVSSQALAVFFALFMLFVATQLLLDVKPRPNRALPGRAGLTAVAAAIGAVSALGAIGGGAMTVPFLVWCNVTIRHAIGTSAAVGFPIAIGGTLGYVLNGLTIGGLPAWSLGFVYLPGLLFLVAASMVTAPLGAAAAHRLPVLTLKRIFAAVLMLLCAKMLHGVFA